MNIPDRALRLFFVHYFNDDELDDFCFDYFPDASREFASGMPVSKKARLLIAHATRHSQRELLIEALNIVRPEQFASLTLLMDQQNINLRRPTELLSAKPSHGVSTPTSLTAYLEMFALGGRTFPFQVMDGDGEGIYTSSSITCVIDPQPLRLLPEVELIREYLRMREEYKRNRLEDHLWNGPVYALKQFVTGRTVPHEHMELRLVLQETDHFALMATSRSLDLQLPDGTTLRQKYLSPPHEDLIPSLAIGLGTVLVLLTSDKKLLLSRRSKKAEFRPGELDVPIVEAIVPELDLASNGTGPDLYRCAIRAAAEEVGITLQRQDIRFLGFGVDHEYYLWNVIGMARLAMTAKEALEEGTRRSLGSRKTQRFSAVSADPDVLWRFLRGEKLWATGWIALYWSLVHEFGRAAVDESAQLHVR